MPLRRAALSFNQECGKAVRERPISIYYRWLAITRPVSTFWRQWVFTRIMGHGVLITRGRRRKFVCSKIGAISLASQHTLVMHFQMPDGSEMEPMVMKHWRQDWTYEDEDLHMFRGDGTWARARRSSDEAAGSWSQAVWQVDDSPRYEAIGKWIHTGNRSAWTGENSWRPLPRREHSVRGDYGVMEGFHRIVITPTGWIHEQNNWKRVSGEGKEPEYRGHELGIDRYERIVSPSLDDADPYWEKTGAYWRSSRGLEGSLFAAR